ncbi:hypothetical protein AT251_14755 [Enterovibrio nigricans]|nr:type VI secretion system-associated protein TagO [Enterovibrio nigricans]PKF49985.1 hypothetical protein AT251_14755 [Enterovibrio nigricans]
MVRLRVSAVVKVAVAVALFQANPALSKASSDKQLSSAMACTEVSSRLERLACFDKVFGTPMSHELSSINKPTKPALWVKASESEKRREARQTGFIVNVSGKTESMPGAWVTSSAMVKSEQEPAILMFSCIDDISRVELILPNVVDSGECQSRLMRKRKTQEPG